MSEAKLIGGILLASMLGWGGWSLWASFRDWVREPIQIKLEAEQTAHKTTKELLAKCGGTVEAQTKGINDLKSESDKRVAESKAALAAAKKEAERLQAQAQGFLTAKPELPDDLCESARRVLVK